MRLNSVFVPTVAAAPRDAVPASFAMLVRGGYVRRARSGGVDLLPLGALCLERLEEAVAATLGAQGAGRFCGGGPSDAELTAAGLSFALLDELMESLGGEFRTQRRGTALFRRRGHLLDSLRRPRNGLLGARRSPILEVAEVSFGDVSAADLSASARARLSAWFESLDLRVTRTRGVANEVAWHARSRHGSDAFLVCNRCGEAVADDALGDQGPGPETATTARLGPVPLPSRVSTPGAKTITEVATLLNASASAFAKTMLYVADGTPVALMIRGDHVLSIAGAKAALGARHLVLADEEMVAQLSGAPVGFAGPVGLRCRTVADRVLQSASPLIVGANEANAHLVDVVLSRDTEVREFVPLRAAQRGDGCVHCEGGWLELVESVCLARSVCAVASDRSPVGATPRVGAHSVIVDLGRLLGIVAESVLDDRGFAWPWELAPAEVTVLALQANDPEVGAAAAELYDELVRRGLRVLLDDRDRPLAAKFGDADLMGSPLRVAIGRRTLADGAVEFSDRHRGVREVVPRTQICELIRLAKCELKRRDSP